MQPPRQEGLERFSHLTSELRLCTRALSMEERGFYHGLYATLCISPSDFRKVILKTCRMQRRAFGGLALVFVVCNLGLSNLGLADVVSASDGEWAPLSLVTGFHTVREPNGRFQVRVIEANGRATVAINPITLYFVVTNDSSAGDLQQHIWRLPVSVARVKSVSPINSGVRIVASLDAVPDANVQARDVNILVGYKSENGVLKDTITVRREEVR
jgi:hypothetical protein